MCSKETCSKPHVHMHANPQADRFKTHAHTHTRARGQTLTPFHCCYIPCFIRCLLFITLHFTPQCLGQIKGCLLRDACAYSTPKSLQSIWLLSSGNMNMNIWQRWSVKLSDKGLSRSKLCLPHIFRTYWSRMLRRTVTEESNKNTKKKGKLAVVAMLNVLHFYPAKNGLLHDSKAKWRLLTGPWNVLRS